MKKSIIFIFKALCIISGAALILMYSFPLYARILNIGNIFGMGLGALIIITTVFFDKLKKIWSSKAGKRFTALILAVIIIFFGAFGITLKAVCDSAQYTAKDERVVLVLGCRVNGTKPSKALYVRTKNAGDYLIEHKDAIAILCGGQGPDESISEAECMFNILTENMGIDASRLYLEDSSTSTDENIKNALKIIESNNMSKEVAISTSSYHLKRASMIAEKYGLTSSSIPARSDKYSIPTFFTREVFGVWWQTLNN